MPEMISSTLPSKSDYFISRASDIYNRDHQRPNKIIYRENSFENDNSSIDDNSDLSNEFDNRSRSSRRNESAASQSHQGKFACNISRRPPVSDNKYIFINV